MQSLDDLKSLVNHAQVYNHIIENNYYKFEQGKTPKATISAQLGDFIRKNDVRVKRIKSKNGTYVYYLTKYKDELNLENIIVSEEKKTPVNLEQKSSGIKAYQERDLHKLLSSYLHSQDIFAKTIYHEQSKNNIDNHQKWIHPDIVGINFLKLSSKVNNAFMKALNKKDVFKFTSYELKKEINTDYELKKSYFQAVSNSSWANYGYLVAFEINSSLMEEIGRLNQSFGIGVIELKSNPYESKILFQSSYKELDYKTIDKLCKINNSFESFIELTEKVLTAQERYVATTEKELIDSCDEVFKSESEISEYCNKKNIPLEEPSVEG